MAQEAAGGDTAALQSVLDADIPLQLLLKEERECTRNLSSANPAVSAKADLRIKEVYALLEEMEASKAESRASLILNGLGFSPIQQAAATRTFSGGWRMRLALARALFCKPGMYFQNIFDIPTDLLLADEVTNYLDFPAVVWLEGYFQNWAGTILLVSHDRSFLDSVSTDILHMHGERLDPYRTTFSVFVATRAERVKAQIREYEAQLSYRQHLQGECSQTSNY